MKQNLYEPCNLHQSQFLQIVCQQCQQASFACPVCIDQYHAGHSMISLKKFIASEIPKLYASKPNPERLEQGISKINNQFLQGFEEMRKNIGNQINQVQQIYAEQAQRMKRQIAVICGKGGYNMQNITAIKGKIKQKSVILDQEHIEKQFENISNQVAFLLSETTDIICKTIQELNQYWKISCDILLNSKKKVKHHFSESLKHDLIELKSPHKKKTQKGQIQQSTTDDKELKFTAVNTTFDSKYHIAVIEPPLNPFKNEVELTIEESINNCVWIGVCDVQKVKKKGFENCYKKNQGCYWIWQSGGEDECQFFSSLLEESVSLQQSIKVGDIITIRLDYCQGQMNKISFFKSQKDKPNSKTLIYRGEIQKKQFHPCVALGDELEKVCLQF